MHALVFHGPRDIRYERHDDPRRDFDNAAILRVELCSICGSDLHIFHGHVVGRTDYETGAEPFCIGHEFIGEIVDVGPDVHRFKIGDRVLSAPGAGCGTCAACLSRVGRCPDITAFGLSSRLNGGQADYVQVPNADRTLLEIPDGVSDEQALLLTDALATASFGIDRAEVAPGDRVAVVGLGPIGLLAVELALARGASQVIGIDPVPERRRHAERLGAAPIEPGPDTRAAVREVTGGHLAGRVLESAGAPAAIASVAGFVRRGGNISFIGLPQGGAALPMADILYRNLTVRAGVADVGAQWPKLVPLLQHGRVRGVTASSPTACPWPTAKRPTACSTAAPTVSSRSSSPPATGRSEPSARHCGRPQLLVVG